MEFTEIFTQGSGRAARVVLPVLLAMLGLLGMAVAAAQGGEGEGLPAEFERVTFELVPPTETGVRAAAVIGPDYRIPVTDTTAEVFRSVVWLAIFDAFDNFVGECSGVLVDDVTVLTSAHCVYSHTTGLLGAAIVAVPAADGDYWPFGGGAAFGDSISLPVGWVNVAGRPPIERIPYDFALVHLQYTEFGTATRPHEPVVALPDSYFLQPDAEIWSAGYPGDKPMATMWFAWGSVFVDGAVMFTDMDIVQGQSGSPVWLIFDGGQYRANVGVVSMESPQVNAALRFTPNHVNALAAWCVDAGCNVQTVIVDDEVSPTATPTNTPQPQPTATSTVPSGPMSHRIIAAQLASNVNTSAPPPSQPTPTPTPPSQATATPTSVPSTATSTPTSVPPTATATPTFGPPTATPTNVATATPTATPTQPSNPADLPLLWSWYDGVGDLANQYLAILNAVPGQLTYAQGAQQLFNLSDSAFALHDLIQAHAPNRASWPLVCRDAADWTALSAGWLGVSAGYMGLIFADWPWSDYWDEVEDATDAFFEARGYALDALFACQGL